METEAVLTEAGSTEAALTEAVLLEHLAATGWFVKHGEVALTGGLTFCLTKDPAAADAFVELVRDRTGLTADILPDGVRWQAEGVDEKRGRVDVAGWWDTDTGPAPVVFIEGKVSADLGSQVSDYTTAQQKKLHDTGWSHGALVVLVPEIRVRPAREAVDADLRSLDAVAEDGRWTVNGEAQVIVTVLSWDDALDAMSGAAERAGCDLQQLRGACRALQGADVRAFTDADLGGGWRTRIEDLVLVINRVTREASAQLSIPPLPECPKPFAGLHGGYHYVGEEGLPNLAVGSRLDDSAPPLWVRWHSRTADIALAESRLRRARQDVQKDEHGLWLPLELTPDVGSATRQIASLVSQVVELYKVAVDWHEAV